MLFIYFLFYVAFNSQGHIPTGSLRVEEPVCTSWSRFCTVIHWVLASDYQLFNMKHPIQDSNKQTPEVEGKKLKAKTLTSMPLSPLYVNDTLDHVKAVFP